MVVGSLKLLKEKLQDFKWMNKIWMNRYQNSWNSTIYWIINYLHDVQMEWKTDWLYSDRTEHFCGRGPRNLTKLLEGLQYIEKLISSPLEPFLAIRVCQKCQKIKNHEKPGFWGNFGYISATVKSIFMIFWDKTPKTNS